MVLVNIVHHRSKRWTWTRGQRRLVGSAAAIILLLRTVLVGWSILQNTYIPSQRQSNDWEENHAQYKCSGWHTTTGIRPLAVRRLFRYVKHMVGGISISCDKLVPPDDTGYCELVHKDSGVKLHTFHQIFDDDYYNNQNNSNQWGHSVNCQMARYFVTFKDQFKIFVPDPPLWFQNNENDDRNRNNPQRGIVMLLYPQVLARVYAIVKLLRKEYGCKLPLELWMHGGDDSVNDSIVHHPILKSMLENDNLTTLRIHWDYRFPNHHTKAYSIAYTHFNEVLVLDSDSFPLRDPTYLFETDEYLTTGALFWQDVLTPTSTPQRKSMFWYGLSQFFEIQQQPVHKASRQDTVHANLPLSSQDEPSIRLDSGLVLIHREQSQNALTMLLFLEGTLFPRLLGGSPSLTRTLMEGGQDWFQFAWRLSDTSHFHLVSQNSIIATPTKQSATTTTTTTSDHTFLANGKNDHGHRTDRDNDSYLHLDDSLNCDSTQIQHDPSGVPLFLRLHFVGANHNEPKLTNERELLARLKWTHEHCLEVTTKVKRVEDAILTYATEALDLVSKQAKTTSELVEAVLSKLEGVSTSKRRSSS